MSDTVKKCSVPEHEALIKNLLQENASLKEQVRDLLAQKNTNSTNSSKPPSSDGYGKPKPKSQRKKTGKKPGGQAGHTGETLQQVSEPDVIQEYGVDRCEECGADLSNDEPIDHECRQEFDMEPPKPVVTEHRAARKLCSKCFTFTTAAFPEHLKQKAQYGSRVKAYATYFNQQHFIPYKRLREVFSDCFQVPVCEGSFVNFNKECAKRLQPSIESIKASIMNSKVGNFDESGMRVNGKLHWLHVSSTDNATYYFIHKKRGKEAIDEIGILPYFQGTAIHDNYSGYMTYLCKHGLCNSHHLRELIFAHENYDQLWAEKLKILLLTISKKVDEYKLKGKTKLSNYLLKQYENEYMEILKNGLVEIPILDLPPEKKRGRIKQHKVKNLWDRLVERKNDVLLFMYDFEVPFTNNLAERDVRMCKVKQKVSGTFRSYAGARSFTAIRSYISTMKKQGRNVLESLTVAFKGRPISIQTKNS